MGLEKTCRGMLLGHTGGAIHVAHGQSYMAELRDATSGSRWQLERAAGVFHLEGSPLAHFLGSMAVPSQLLCPAQRPRSSSFRHPSLPTPFAWRAGSEGPHS